MHYINSNLIESLSFTMRGYVRSIYFTSDKYSVSYMGNYYEGYSLYRNTPCKIRNNVIYFQTNVGSQARISQITIYGYYKNPKIIKMNVDIYPGLTDIEIEL